MKTRLFATGVLLAMTTVAFAERPPGPPQVAYNIDKLEILLDLDAYQKSEVQKIFDARRDAMRTQREQMRSAATRPSREQMQKEREASAVATRAQLQKVLTEQQLKKLEVLTERPEKNRRARN